MKTKQEAIKEAYGEYYYDLKEFISDNGWISFFNDEKRIRGIFHGKKNIEVSTNHDDNNWRPKSLQGIENNNGWIKIESEKDLPKDTIECVTCFYDGNDYVEGDTRDRNPIQLWKAFKNNQITHYKKTIKQPKPLY